MNDLNFLQEGQLTKSPLFPSLDVLEVLEYNVGHFLFLKSLLSDLRSVQTTCYFDVFVGCELIFINQVLMKDIGSLEQDDEYLEKSRKAIYLYLPKIIFENY